MTEPATRLDRIGAGASGRNEGERLVRCLASLQGAAGHLVYVDSGSTDNSVAAARAAGAEVVELDMSVPFTAARARNARVETLIAKAGDAIDYVQCVDGDCAMVGGWIPKGAAALDANPEFGMVTGWRSELNRDASISTAVCDFEWHRPAGEILACGGDMMVRRAAFEQVGGFNPVVIAAEDDEFCTRLRKAGWRLERLPEKMTRHDAAMTRFGQWWQRAVRTGHGFAQVNALHPEYFATECRRVWRFGLILPLIALMFLAFWPWGVALVLAVYGLSYLRTVRGLVRDGLDAAQARSHAMLISLSKFPNLIGILTYWTRRWRGRSMRLIEYK